jgi:hypothetical protein
VEEPRNKKRKVEQEEPAVQSKKADAMAVDDVPLSVLLGL